MYKTALFIGFFLLLTPAIALAATPVCSAQGYTVVFVNGVFDTYKQALGNSDTLREKLGPQYNSEPVIVRLGYNPTHLAGAGDLVQTVAQLFNGSISNFDLDTILLQIYPEVTTRKLLLVGHSQGAFYTNSMYDYLLSHGEPDSSVAVYNVASPAAYTAGGGKYINSSGDSLLTLLRSLKFDVLPDNADLVPTGNDGDYSGHAFDADYLEQAAPQMLADMDGEMGKLQPTDASQTGDCFTPPSVTFGYKAQAAAFAIADPTATVLKAGSVATVHASEVALNAATKLTVGALQLFSDSIVITSQPPSEVHTTAATEKIIDKLYGSSLDGLSPQDKKELLGSAQGASVIGVVLGTSTVANAVAIATSTPIVPKNIFPDSSNGPVWSSGGPTSGGGDIVAAAVVVPVAESTPLVIDTPATVPADPAPIVVEDPAVDIGDAPVVINEIEWAGDMFDGGREWIEIKNRTADAVDLSQYVIYAKSGGSQYIALTGTVRASGFFVVQRDPAAPLPAGLAQVTPFGQLADSGEQLVLARIDASGTTTIDMTPALNACNGWCAGSGVNPQNQGETLSMERVSSDVSGTLHSNWASNDMFTVGGGLMPPISPADDQGLPLYATPLAENSQHWPATGFFCDPDTRPITPGQIYHPPTGYCTVIDRHISYPGPISAAVFKGTVGSSTRVGMLYGRYNSGMRGRIIPVDFSNAQDGDQYFVAIWQPYFDATLGGVGAYSNPFDDERVPSYLTTGHWLARDGIGGPFTVDMTDAPDPANYTLIPFTYQQ